jgi:Protein of unknown function (DUF2934)
MAKRRTPRSEARDTAAIANPPLTPREAASSTAIDIEREREPEPLDSGVASSEPNEDEIRRRAYQRYLERGGGDGQDFDDWLEAERELRQK